MENIKKQIPTIATLVGSIFLWEIVVSVLNVPEYLFPRASIKKKKIIADFDVFLRDTSITFVEAFIGFLISNIISIFVAVGFCHSKFLERSIYPYIIALKSVPVIAIAPLLVLWVGYGIEGKILMAAIISFFPLVVNATVGLKSVDEEMLDLMKSYSASKLQILFKLRFPIAIPFIMSALKISSTLAVVGAIVGELTGAKEGIGFTILMASYNIDTPKLFGAIIFASFTGIIFFWIVVAFERYMLSKFGFNSIKRSEDVL